MGRNSNEIIRAIEQEAQAAHDAYAMPAVDYIPCCRCNGTGHGTFGQIHGVCFRCGGSGRVPANRAAQRALNKARAERDVICLRIMYRGTRAALQAAEVVAAATPRPDKDAPREDKRAWYKAGRAVKDLGQRLSNIEVHGKEAAALAANPHARAR